MPCALSEKGEIRIRVRSIYFIVMSLLFLLILFAFYLAFDKQCRHPHDGERVLIHEDNTRTLSDKLDRLQDLACFSTKCVRWHTPLIGGFLSAALITLYVSFCHLPTSLCGWFFTIFVPAFVAQYLTTQYVAYHGPSRMHAEAALRLRKEIAREMGH